MWLPQLDPSPSALSTTPLNNMTRTSSHFQGTGYGTSSSTVIILFISVPLFASRCSTIDICSSVVHSLPESPFSLISPLTLSNHLILGLPLFRTFSSSFFLRSALLFSPYARTSSASYIGLPLRFLAFSVPRSRIFLILLTCVTSHIHRTNFFYCSFCNVPSPNIPLSCTASPRIFTFIFCHPTLHRFS